MSSSRVVRAVSPSMLPAVVRLLEDALRGTVYLAGTIDSLRAAVEAPSADARALAAFVDERLEGVAIFGIFGGSQGAGRLHAVVVQGAERRTGAGEQLVDAVLAELREEGARFVLAEMPDDPRVLVGAREFLEALGFREESRIANFYRDGIALAFMRRELGTLA